MKNFLTILALLACACSVPASEKVTDKGGTDEKGANELAIHIRLVTGERSKDSSSKITKITVERDSIVWVRGTSGGRRTTTAPVRKEFTLSPADKQNLLKLIRANNLLVTDSIVLPQATPSFYFDVSVDLTLGKKSGAINISAPRNDMTVREEKLYQNTLALVTELHRIMNRQDKSVPVCATFFC